MIKILLGIGIVLALLWIGGILYMITGIGKFFYHNVLGWHKPSNEESFYDGCSLHNHCKYCGKEIMQDSQGNWF